MDAHTKFDTLVGWHVRVALRHPALRLDGATSGVHGARELNQSTVAGAFNNAASVSRDRRIKKFTAVSV
jgi:hypothetical protein